LSKVLGEDEEQALLQIFTPSAKEVTFSEN